MKSFATLRRLCATLLAKRTAKHRANAGYHKIAPHIFIKDADTNS